MGWGACGPEVEGSMVVNDWILRAHALRQI